MSDINSMQRNDRGLLEGVEYIFNEKGLIAWRKMLDNKWLYPNPTKNLPTQDVTKLKDYDLCILLGGIKELAQVRGYTNVEYDISCPSSDYVVANCKITWVPNFETEGKEVVFSSIGDASPNNTESFAKQFLGPIAENRAFVRCVRNFLRINIVAKDELAKKIDVPYQENEVNSAAIGDASPAGLLRQMMDEKGVTFERVKNRLAKQEYKGASDLSKIEDIPAIKIFELLNDLKKVKAT